MKEYLTAEEIAAKFGVTPATVRNWIKAGILTGKKIGGRFRVSKKVLDKFEEQFLAKAGEK